MFTGEMFTRFGSAIGGLAVIWAMFQQYIPPQLREHVERYTHKLVSFVNPYIQIVFPEFSGEKLKSSEAYTAIQNYLTTNATAGAKRLRADSVKDSSQSLILSMDDHEEVTDVFNGVKVWWSSNKTTPKNMSFSFYPKTEDRRFYRLTFHRRHRELITQSYVKHILTEGKAIAVKNRQRKLYTNNASDNWYDYKQTKWSHVVFEHPATFETLAMEPSKRQEIMNDLKKFSKGKEYYTKIGKAWKRGYLLYGPPGTGKSTMIAAMANFLNYDVYDLELTAVKDNTELRKLLIETSGKSIIVIEDIDCSLDLTGQRKKKDKDEENKGGDKDNPAKKIEKEEKKGSKVTLSGLLNFIDGIWSACGGERIIIFTTNYVDKLDPALIRRGRMDKHIEMSYCCFEAFKVLARNYLDIEDHGLFPTISELFDEAKVTPADVAENLMPKSDGEDAETGLRNLIEALKVAKELEARKKAEEEARAKAGKEEQEKKENGEEEIEKDSGKSDKEVKENGVINGGMAAKDVKENGFAA
ncbi:AAA-ATPase ASD, mitochondrial-like isoform X1 [Rhodamnia argentea]|uniref:AAA-ATPase ASD, mitochondrial-like isoform X1 n=1 Tax=Rhodamnia argentea TaxID=178133 RepID=A0A8B8R275_9MYRT|nr:AAA-ATPase ASD, mitochondrial-like isoform X1 [Rhodamnia argentea]